MSELHYEYVGFWKRVLASLIDTLLLIIIIVPLLTFVYGAGYWSSGATEVHGMFDIFIQFIFPAVAVVLFWFYKQATPGKMLVGARIVDINTGESPAPGKFIVRYIAYIVSSLPLCLGFIWVAFDQRKQGWHDKMSGTAVVRVGK